MTCYGGMVKWLGPCQASSPDPDACFGYKSKTRPCFGHKAHLEADADSGIVVAQVTTPGNEADGEVLEEVLESVVPASALVADKDYDTQNNHALLRRKKIRNYIIRTTGGRASTASKTAHRQPGVFERPLRG